MRDHGKYSDKFYEENWQNVSLTEDELDRMCEAADRGDIATACAAVDEAYARLVVDEWPDVVEDFED